VINFLESGCILWSVDELSRKWMKTVVSSEVDEIFLMSEWPDRATRVARDTRWTSRADGHPDGCPTEGGQVPDGGRTGAQRRA
jgi:hypothetical protein